ncbi:lysophospholipase L1-like esterase [Aeromicrobium panaciterrae]|uniref:Lysophospholipase L1-like esterase n=1 Tax=Aeromicrobium panaciterrae TaxID=363861 RepID=A0ABU1UQB2_9ACTN|nr:SGNH/GDSL hydrolase family protein [Aeromicrobium panaciterrae]MDR7087368.1 lysophospholipase L1-like esterase [Aeromicrobium panaciterrae]
MVHARHAGVALVALALLATAACSSDKQAPQPTNPFDSYVAMGDSSVAGPGIDPTNLLSGPCARSKNNWPALLAKELKTKNLDDVSCSGAVSADILLTKTAANATTADAQIDAVTADTDLVTVSIGGNDEGVYTKIILACLAGKYASDSACASFMDTKLDAILKRTTDHVATTLERIRTKAPKARVVMVGYLRLLPDTSGCDVPGITDSRLQPSADAWTALNQALTTAAKRADVDYVSLADQSIGHESCNGDQAWVNGLQAVPGDGAFLHPNAAGMHAVAKVVADHLER